MKKILLILTVALLPSLLHASVAEGDEAYREGDYAEAIEHYETVLAEGYASAELYYNLAGAYYRQGEMGRAILNYERALRLKPNMKDAKENLALAESHTTDRIAQLPVLFVVRWYNGLLTCMTPSAWRTVWLILLALTGMAVVLFRLGATKGQRKSGLIVGLVALLLLALTTVMLLASTHRYNTHADAIVMESALAVKGSPEAQSVDKLLLHEGTKVHIQEELRGWYKIRIADGTTGWCQQESVERI